MTALQSILVVVDKRMRKSAAFDRGVALARKSGARLYLCLFDHDLLIERALTMSPEVARRAKIQFLHERQTWLVAQAAALAEHNIATECDVIWASRPHEAILDKVLEIMPGLVIKDVQGEPMRQHLINAPLDWRILRYCPVPVMMVRPSTRYLPRRIALAIDLPKAPPAADTLNQAIFDNALQLGRYCDAEIHVAHVGMPSVPLSAEGLTLSAVYAEAKRRDAQLFTDLCLARQVPREDIHWVEGEPAVELARLAQRMDIDLLVLGSSYRSVADRLLFGSTTESLLSQAECDVLLVKGPDFTEELQRHLDLPALRRRQAQQV